MIYDVERFVKAQKYDYDKAFAEMKNGKKQSHWIWYIFPQLKGLGFSSASDFYGIDGISEARAYMEHPILKARLLEISQEGCDYRQYSIESKKDIAEAASTACSIKAVLDTPILKEDGALTEESNKLTEKIGALIYQ